MAADSEPIPEIATRRRDESYEQLLQRLSVQSVKKHFDAYADVAWDDPANAIRQDDPRWQLSGEHSLGATAWYQAQPAALRATIGLNIICNAMKTGVVFESVLKRGLLEFAATLPNGAPEFRYAYHEVIEEAQHSLMFQEFINRSGFDPTGLPLDAQVGARFVVGTGRRFPELFFLFVLGGEEPIDFVQRRELRSGREQHPLLKRISQIHITEEARHLCFARQYLKRNVPQLPAPKRVRLAVAAPVILGQMARLMLRPSPSLIRRYAIPRAVIDEAYSNNRQHKQSVRDSLASVTELCKELQVLTPQNAFWWRRAGLGDPFRATT